MADLLSLTGDVVGLGDSDVEDFNSFAPDTPHVMLQLADGRSLMVLGITRDEARKLGIGFSEPLTLSLSTAALAPVAVQEEGDAWKPIETAPVGRTMFLAATIGHPIATDRLYTTDPWVVWQDQPGTFIRWPHKFKPSHWAPIPSMQPSAIQGDQP